jgi:hypothetical protein
MAPSSVQEDRSGTLCSFFFSFLFILQELPCISNEVRSHSFEPRPN